MKTDYADEPLWLELAKARGIRLPQRGTPLTTARMKQMARLVGWTPEDYRQWSGFRTFAAFIEANPTWSARAFAGLLLEATND